MEGYRFANLPSSTSADEVFVILSLSGGGTRAAALAYGVLEQLRDDSIQVDGKSARLLDQVDVISSVSGGSFAAAYYGLYGERTFTDFKPQFLNRNIQGLLIRMMFNPINWFRLASPRFGRSDLAAERYDKVLFEKKTFGDLERLNTRPLIVINATDMTLVRSFPFTQEQMDLLCTDLATFPVSRAVAASGAFPIALSPITLVNHSAEGCIQPDRPWIANALEDFDVEKRRYQRAVAMQSYLDGKRRPYVHLLDGGIADNIGLRGPLDAILSGDLLTIRPDGKDAGWNVLRLINGKRIKKVVVIAVNAKKQGREKWDRKESPPRVPAVRKYISTAPMGNYSIETLARMKEECEDMGADDRAFQECRDRLASHGVKDESMEAPLPHVDFYPIEVSFDALEPKERDYFDRLPTSLSLTDEQVDKLEAVGRSLLKGSPCYQKLLAGGVCN
jgi:NTE family protein